MNYMQVIRAIQIMRGFTSNIGITDLLVLGIIRDIRAVNTYTHNTHIPTHTKKLRYTTTH